MPGIEWISTLDNSGFISSMNEMSSQIRRMKASMEAMGMDATSAMERMSSAGDRFIGTLRNIGAIAGVTFSVAQAKSFVDKISETRAYFQDIESSMKVFLGSEKAASDFTSKLKDYAYYNMFEFSDLANASKQMIAYKHNVEDIIPRLDQLSNVARGTNAPLMEMVNAYNKAKNLGGLDGRDLQSWAAKGLVVKDILKEMGETVQGNRVSFEQLNKVLDKVTGEGGMFHNLMGEQMNNISAEQGQLEDTLASMYNELGEKYQDTIVKWYKMNSEIAENFVDNTSVIMDAGAGVADFLIEHYKQIGITIMSLVAAVGEYRAALIALNAVKGAQQSFLKDEEIRLLDEAIEKEKQGYEEVLALKEKAKNADLAESVAKGELTEKQAALIAAKRAELEQLQVSKETLAVDHQINEMKALKLDEDLQEKIATQQLTLAQAEEIQQRRAVLESLEQEIAKRKELKLAKVEGQINTNNTKRQEKVEENEYLQMELEETSPTNVRKQDEIYESIAENKRIINELDAENANLLKEQEAIILRYGTKDEKLEFLEKKKQSLEEQLALQREEEESYERQRDKLVSIREGEENRLNLLREQWEAQRKENRESADGGNTEREQELRQELDAQIDKVNVLNDLTHAQEESKLETLAQTAAEKAKDIQDQIDTVETQKNTIATGANTKAKTALTTATNAQTLSERIHTATMKASSIATAIFSKAIDQAKLAIKGMGAAIMNNPLGIFIGALTMALPYLMNWIDWSGEAKNTQDALNDSVENFKKKLSDNESEERKEIKTIQDKNASLYDQYKAYQELIKARKIFGEYSQEQLAAMSSEEIDALFSKDNASKQREFMENERKALEEFREWAKNKNAAWATANDKEKLQEVAKKYSLPQETVDEWWKSVNWNTDWSEWSSDMLSKATEGWQQRLEDEASAGIASGLKKGFSDHSVQAQATSLLSEFSSYVENTSSDDLEANGEKIATSFKERLMPAIEETKAKISQLRDEWAEATGDKKVSVKAELDSSEQMLEFLNSIMSLFEGGVNNKELVIKIQRESENAQLGADVLQDISKDYEEVDKVAEKYLGNLELATQKAKEMGATTKGEAQEIAREFGLTKEGLEENLGSIEKRVRGEIDDLQDKYIKARDEVARNKLQIEIQRRQELLDHITAIKDRVYDVIKNPYNLVINIGAKIAEGAKNFLKGLLGKDMPSFWEDGGKSQNDFKQGSSQREKSRQAQTDAESTKSTETAKKKEATELTDAEKKAREKAAKEAQRKAEKAAADEANRRHKLADIERRETERQEKQRIDTENALEEARIAGIRDNGARERAERENQYRLSMQRIRTKEEEFRKQNLDIIRQRWEANNKDKNKNFTDTQEYKDYVSGKTQVELTKDQEAEIRAEEAKTNAEYLRMIDERNKAEMNASLEFLKQYGSIEEQKLAIAKDYEQRIQDASTPTERASLSLQRDREIEEYEKKNLMDAIDWTGVFNELSGHTEEYLKGLRDQLQQLLRTGNLPIDQMETIQGKIREINDELNAQGGILNFMSAAQREHVRRLQEAKDAQDALNAAKNEETARSMEVFAITRQIRDEMAKVGIPSDTVIDDNLIKKFKDGSEEAKRMGDMLARLKEAQAKYNEAGEKTRKRAFEWKKAEDAANESLKDAIARVAGNINEWVQKYLGDLPALLEEIGLGGAGQKVSKGLSAINNAAGAAADYASGNYVGAALKAVSAVKDVVGIFSTGSNHEEQLAIQEELSAKIDSSTKAIEKLTETLEESYGSDAIKAYEELVNTIGDNLKATVLKIDSVLTDNYEGGHSDYYHVNKQMDILDQITAYGRKYNITAGTWQELLSNDAESLAKTFKDIMEQDKELWYYISHELGYNEGALGKTIEELVEQYEQLGEADKRLKEQLTTTSFDNVWDSFMDSLYNLADGSEEVFDDVAESWRQMVNRMVLNNLVGNKYKKQLEDWYNEIFSQTYDIDEDAYKDNLRNARKEYERIMREGAEEVERLRDVGLITSSSEAKADKNATNTMAEKATYEQFETYLGIATAQQIALEQIKAILQRWDGSEETQKPVVSDITKVLADNFPDSEEDFGELAQGIADAVRDIDDERSSLDLTPLISPYIPSVERDAVIPTVEMPSRPIDFTSVESGMMSEQGRLVSQNIAALHDITSANGMTATEIRRLIETSNEHLLDIKKSNREILEAMSTRLDNMNNLIEKKL